MKKIVRQLLFLVFLCFPSSVFAEQINTFTTDTLVRPDGLIEVVETIEYDFSSQERHGIERRIDRVKENEEGKKFQLAVDIVAVTDENNKPYIYKEWQEGEYVVVRIGDPDKTITGSHTYKIAYTVSGALTYFSDHDELYWNTTGSEWNVPIVSAVSVVTLPEGIAPGQIKAACFTGASGSTDRECLQSIDGQTVTMTNTQPFGLGEGLTIVVGFPKGHVAVVEPDPYKTFFETWLGKAVLVVLFVFGVLWYVVYPVWIMAKWWITGRDPRTSGPVAAWYDPPSTRDGRKLLPAEAGTLIDETVHLKDISATIVDMARRGFLRIEERSKNDFYLVRTDPKNKSKPLTSYEVLLYEALFAPENFKPTLDLVLQLFPRGSGNTLPTLSLQELKKKMSTSSAKILTEVRLKNLKMADTLKDIEKTLYQTVVAEGFFDKNPHNTRTFYTIIGTFALFTLNIPLAFVAFIIGRHMPKKTMRGAQQSMVARSLKNFLDGQERQLAFQAKNQMWFEKLLPYAVAFGVEKHWAEQFKDIALTSPSWYSTYNNRPFNSVYFTNSLGSSFTSFARAATPTSSSSGFSSGFSGGSVGGGGGGGGGGSW